MDILVGLAKFGVFVSLWVFWSKWRRRQQAATAAAAAVTRAGFSLKEGIFLEESRSLLRWGCTQREAFATGAPRPYEVPLLPSGTVKDYSALSWRESALGGIPVGISVRLPEGEGLSSADLYFRGAGKPRDHHWFFFDHLVPRLGNPTAVRVPGAEGGDPKLVWRFEGCRLTLYTTEHHGEFTLLNIEREEPPVRPAAMAREP